MSPELSPESKLLAHFEEIHKILGTNEALAESAAEMLERSPTTAGLRRALNKAQRSSLSYYKEKYAVALIPILDKLEQEQKPLFFLLSDFEPRISMRTLYLRIYQGWHWLMDYHPDKARFLRLWGDSVITCLRGKGVRIAPEAWTDIELKPHEDKKSMLTAAQLQRYISEAIEKEVTEPTIVLENNELSLTDDEIESIKDSLAGLPSITAIIEAHRIKILKKP
jgi:hypothetical protein